MPITPCFDCGDRVIFTVPNENFKEALLEIGFEEGPWRYVEIDYPFVMVQYQEDEMQPPCQSYGEKGDRLGYRADLDQWGVKNVT